MPRRDIHYIRPECCLHERSEADRDSCKRCAHVGAWLSAGAAVRYRKDRERQRGAKVRSRSQEAPHYFRWETESLQQYAVR